MSKELEGKRIVLGVTGSIASYKAVYLASKLVQSGALVDVLMTESAIKFVSPLTFSGITHRSVFHGFEAELGGSYIQHVELANDAEMFVVAPATANTIAKLAFGLADDVVSATALASRARLVICPAMDGYMYENKATQENLEKLKIRGCIILGPEEGYLASGLSAFGRLADPDLIFGHICRLFGYNGDLSGYKIVVTAGGTIEPIDPVRFISNRSTGKMGYAIAEAARDRGASTLIVSAATLMADPVGVTVEHVETADQMHAQVVRACENADVLIMAAAVSDWRASNVAKTKLKKSDDVAFSFEVTRTPDILTDIKRQNLIKVGFAAETEDLESNARMKLESKGLDLIAANDVSDKDGGFASDNNSVILIDRNGGIEETGLISKYAVGNRILDRVLEFLK